MDLPLGWTTLLVLMLQALNGVRLQDVLVTNMNIVGNNTSDVNANNTMHGNMIMPNVFPMLNSSNGLPASMSTAGNPITASPDIVLPTTNVSLKYVTAVSNSTGPSNTSLPNVTNATVSSALNTTTKSWDSNGTADAPNATVTVAPESHHNASSTTEHIPGPPQANSTSTTTTVTSPTSTVTSSTSTTTTTTGLNTTAKAGASGNNTDDRGFASTKKKATNNSKAWGAIIGTALAVGFLGFIIYILLKKRNRQEFMHRKLIEDMPSEPVLRLDNGEPLDLKFEGLAYYNPGLQGDHIQMTNFPQGHMR
ncbi:hypothetical protein SKAU_G00412650 [Synaphobranchus kaupii]|uniref:Mucin-15 n=1 Tax=Synaphobranchus kaupii TaxID=118154 RepID=A0A9Q1IBX2_SYNKA|nr:hypothetical protein SKAU_G00412650 [Synaphobranchus kaupii]